jgi:hypothetical protein
LIRSSSVARVPRQAADGTEDVGDDHERTKRDWCFI